MSEVDVIAKKSPLNIIKWLVAIAVVIAAVAAFQIYSVDVPVLYRAVGFVVAIIIAALIALQTVEGKAFNQYRKDSWTELQRVFWPTRQETIQTTYIVIIFVVIVSLMLWGFDLIIGGLFKLIGITG